MDAMTPEEFRQFVLAAMWHVARTMPQIPHEYCLRREVHDKELFEQAVLFIREHGYKQEFRGRTYTYLDVDDHAYWTQGSPLGQTVLINRARL
jgi:hypothetical protein